MRTGQFCSIEREKCCNQKKKNDISVIQAKVKVATAAHCNALLVSEAGRKHFGIHRDL